MAAEREVIVDFFDPDVNVRTFYLQRELLDIPSATYHRVREQAMQREFSELEDEGQQIMRDLLVASYGPARSNGGNWEAEKIELLRIFDITAIRITKNCAASWSQIEQRLLDSAERAFDETFTLSYPLSSARQLVGASAR